MIDVKWLEKLKDIGLYLESLFPGYLVEQVEDSLRTQLFQKFFFEIKDDRGEVRHRFSIDYGFLHHNTSDEAVAYFEKRDVKSLMERAGGDEVIATDDGIRVMPVRTKPKDRS